MIVTHCLSHPCQCCDAFNKEITSCPTNAALPWNPDTCTCASCSKESIMACGGYYNNRTGYGSSALDEKCDCYYRTRKHSWASAIIYGASEGKELLDVDCALQNVDVFKDDEQGRRLRADLWDDGLYQQGNFSDGVSKRCQGCVYRLSRQCIYPKNIKSLLGDWSVCKCLKKNNNLHEE